MNQVEFERSGEAPLWEISFDDANPECKHPLPGDWDFGVDPTSNETGEPRTDPRWQPQTFMYLDRSLRRIAITQVPRCAHEAIGSHRLLVEKQTGQKVYYITGGLPGEKPLTIYSDVDGALSALQG